MLYKSYVVIIVLSNNTYKIKAYKIKFIIKFIKIKLIKIKARVAKLVDAQDLKSCDFNKVVPVQIWPWAPLSTHNL